MNNSINGHFDSKVSGIPCQILIETCNISQGNYSPQAETPEEYYGSKDIEFTILDKKGYIANWLTDKMTNQDEDRIIEEIKEYYYDC